MGVCNCSMFCCTLLYVHFSIAIILMGKRELIALLNLSSWCLVVVERLFLTVPRGCLQFVDVVFPDHTHLLFLILLLANNKGTDQTVMMSEPVYLSVEIVTDNPTSGKISIPQLVSVAEQNGLSLTWSQH